MRSKKAFYNTISTLILQIIILFAGFIIPRYIITSFGSDVNGLVSSISQFLGYIALLESGVGPVVRSALYKPIANKDKETITNILKASERFFRIIAIIFLIYLLILSSIYPIIVNKQFDYWYTVSLILIISISTFFEYYFGMSYMLYLQAEQKKYITSTIQIITYILNVIIVIILIKFGFGIHIVKLASGLIFLLRPIFQNLYVRKKYHIDLKFGDKNYKLEKKWDGLAQHIAGVIHSNTDVTVLTFFSNLAEVSVYSVYSMVTRGIKSIVQSFASGVEATFGDMIAKSEKENLNKKFKLYEYVYYTITTIFYTCTLILIVPFVKVYTLGISDANYIRPLFGILLVVGEFVNLIRMPYLYLTLSMGHFKETSKGAWVEALSNIILSVILVIKWGIIGVAIGTLVSMVIRTVEIIYHASKYVLERSIMISIKNVFFTIMETIISTIIIYYIPKFEVVSYSSWFIFAIITFIVVSIVTVFINTMINRSELNSILNLLKGKLKRKGE